MWFRGFFRRRDRDAQLNEELQFHLDEEAEERREQGLSADDARWAARRDLGNLALLQEDTRAVWGWTFVEQLGQDLRYGLRSLVRSPSFTAAAALTIALGVGANTAVFSLMNAVLFRSLPVPNPAELVFPEAAGSAGTSGAPPYPCLVRLRDETKSFAGLSAFTNVDEMRVEIDRGPEQATGIAASGNFLEVLGVKAAMGRLLETRDENMDPPVALIADRYWQRRFGADPAVLGKTFVFGTRAYTIVGVLPGGFRGLEPGRIPDIVMPLHVDKRLEEDASTWAFLAIARLKPGITLARAQAEADAVFRSFMSTQQASYPADMLARSFHHLELTPAAYGLNSLRGKYSKPLYLLMGIVGLLLLLAAANIANLLLARGIARQREFAIRLATGAGRARLVRQLTTETLLLAVIGAVPGIFLAGWAVRIVESMFAQGRRAIVLEASLDFRVLAFSTIVTFAAALLSGLFPAWRVFRADPEEALKAGHARAGDSRGAATLSRALVSLQVAVSLILLVGAVSFVRTLWNLRRIDTGVSNDRALTMSVEVVQAHEKPDEAGAFWGRLLADIRGIPGVRSAAMSVLTPLSGRDRGMRVRVRGFQPANPRDAQIHINQVSEGYFETLGIPLVRGRMLSDRDAAGAPRVALLNETAARKFFAGRDAVGEEIRFQGNDTAWRIVGVVHDTRHRSLRETPAPFVFLPIRQPKDADRRVTLSVVAANPGSEAALLSAIRNVVATTDSRMLVSEVITLRSQFENTILTERLLSGLAAVFGALALLLAAVGLYGVLSHYIGRQRRAIGIRMALGASAASIRRRVLWQSLMIVITGLAVGLPFAILAARAADTLFWDVTSRDLVNYGSPMVVLALVGLISSFVPARTASRIAPAEALRHD